MAKEYPLSDHDTTFHDFKIQIFTNQFVNSYALKKGAKALEWNFNFSMSAYLSQRSKPEL